MGDLADKLMEELDNIDNENETIGLFEDEISEYYEDRNY